jgi:hypothetical protein
MNHFVLRLDWLDAYNRTAARAAYWDGWSGENSEVERRRAAYDLAAHIRFLQKDAGVSRILRGVRAGPRRHVDRHCGSNRPSVTKSNSRGRPLAQPRELFADCRDQRQRRGDFMLRTAVAAEDTFNIRQRHARERVSGARL